MRISRMVAVGGIASMLALAGCTSTPDEPLPVPTSAPSTTPAPEYTPGFDAEADVEAAIKTYEAYVEASNNLVIADRETWDPVLELLKDPYLTESISGYEELETSGHRLEGSAKVVSAAAIKAQKTVINLHVCTDFSKMITLDANGVRVGTDADYGTKSMNVILQAQPAAEHGWAIVHFGRSELSCS